MPENPTHEWSHADWSAAMTAYLTLPDTATVGECRTIIGAAVEDARKRRADLTQRLGQTGPPALPGQLCSTTMSDSTSETTPQCNGLCVRNRDRGYLDPYDITVGDRIVQPDPNCPTHGTDR